MHLRYVAYFFVSLLVCLYLFGLILAFTGDLTVTVFICGLIVVGIGVSLWMKKRKGGDWKLHRRVFEEASIKIFEPEGLSIAILVMRSHKRMQIKEKIREALCDIASRDKERANVLVIVAIPPEVIPESWRGDLARSLERITIDETECLHFGPSLSVDLEPFRRQGWLKRHDKVLQQLVVNLVLEPVDAAIIPLCDHTPAHLRL